MTTDMPEKIYVFEWQAGLTFCETEKAAIDASREKPITEYTRTDTVKKQIDEAYAQGYRYAVEIDAPCWRRLPDD